MATIKLVSLGTRREVEVPDNATVKDVREIAAISDDLELRFNGAAVRDEAGTRVGDGATVSASAPSVKHGDDGEQESEGEGDGGETATPETEGDGEKADDKPAE